MSQTIPEPKPPPPKAEWPVGTYKANFVTFEEFAKENFVPGQPSHFTKKEVRKPILVYTPEKEKDAVVKIWRVMMRFMGDMVDYRKDYEHFSGHKSYQPDMGSVMTRLCRILGTPQMDNPFGPQHSQVEPVLDIPMQTLPNKPRHGTWKRLKNTITQRLFGKGRKTVFHLLPLEETLRTQLERLQFIVGYGILRPRLRDEIYCGLCRQLTHNVYKESVKKGWLLLNIITGCFPPSERCLDAIVQFLDSGPKIHTASAKALLLRTLKNGDRLHPPSALELEAVSEYKPLELKLHLPGTAESVTIPVDGASTSGEVCDAAVRQLGIKNGFGFHVFVTTRDKVSSLGCGHDHIMDALSQLEQMARDYGLTGEDANWRLYLRKEIFEPWEDLSCDPIATNLIYAQLKSGVLNHDYEFNKEKDLHSFLAKVYYTEHGSELNQDLLKDNYISKWIRNKPGVEDLTEKRLLEEIKECVASVNAQFSGLYDEQNKPNTFNVKLDIIAQARYDWIRQFARIYEAGAFENGDVIDGVNYLSVHSRGLSLLGENHLVIQEIMFTEILQLSQENDPDHEAPPSLVFTVLGNRIIECITQDVDDVTDLVSYFLMGLTEQSIFAVAIGEHTASTTNDLDLQIGDLITLNSPAGKAPDSSEDNAVLITYKGRNTRTGQTGEVQGELIHILPTVETPDNKILDCYREHYD